MDCTLALSWHVGKTLCKLIPTFWAETIGFRFIKQPASLASGILLELGP